jgi:hypothetical protein
MLIVLLYPIEKEIIRKITKSAILSDRSHLELKTSQSDILCLVQYADRLTFQIRADDIFLPYQHRYHIILSLFLNFVKQSYKSQNKHNKEMNFIFICYHLLHIFNVPNKFLFILFSIIY